MSQTTHGGPKLSVAMIVLNAEDTIGRTLQTVWEIADEIVVLDTGSTDRTREVAKEYATVVLERPWDDDFAAARNACLGSVTGDWVLWLDDGETLGADAARHLRQMIDGVPERQTAYMMLVQIPPSSENIAGEQAGRIRLVPNHPSIRFVGRVRESLAESLAENDIRIEGLPWRIDRSQREHDQRRRVRKARRDLKLADLEIKKNGPAPRWLNCIGDALQVLKDVPHSLEFFQHAVDGSKIGSSDQLEAYYGLLTSLDAAEDDQRARQLSICLQALEIFPFDAQLLCAMGGYLQSQGKLDLSIRAYQTAFRYGKVNPETWHLTEVAEIAAVCCSLALQLKGKDEEARQLLEEAVEKFPDSARLAWRLIDLHVKYGRRDEALALVVGLPEGVEHREALRGAVRGACLAVAKNWISANAQLQTAYRAGCREPFCLRWYSAVLLSTGQVDEAKPVVGQWLQAEPTNVEAKRYLVAIEKASEAKNAPGDVAPQAEAVPESATDRHVRIDRATPTGAAPIVMPADDPARRESDVSNPLS